MAAKIVTLLLISAALFLYPAMGVKASDLKYKRTLESYSLPNLTLTNQNGKKVSVQELIQSDRPLIVNFIYGSCTTICPVLSAGFVNLQNILGEDPQKVHLVSISIDPENDTPKVMKEYLKRYGAKPGWDFLTGSRKDIDSIMKAFNAYIPNKMSHYPLTLIRSPADGKWIRIFGLLNSAEFVNECQILGIK